MVRQASLFYKEIIGWYEDILQSHLLDNFSLRWSFIKETMFRNDFRFFPLSHKDLHILSWLTLYVSIWFLVNAIELFTIIIIGQNRTTTERERTKARNIFSFQYPFSIQLSNRIHLLPIHLQ